MPAPLSTKTILEIGITTMEETALEDLRILAAEQFLPAART